MNKGETAPSHSSKRSRVAAVHNQSERVFFNDFNVLKIKFTTVSECLPILTQKRRDRINQKMKTLQRLVPNANKVFLALF